MIRTVARLTAATTLFAAVLAAPIVTAPAAPGIWTQITVPSKTTTYHYTPGGVNTLHVAGKTSAGVATVDIDCVTFIVGQETQFAHISSGVPVNSRTFNVIGTL